jgi:hypothetical protein
MPSTVSFRENLSSKKTVAFEHTKNDVVVLRSAIHREIEL